MPQQSQNAPQPASAEPGRVEIHEVQFATKRTSALARAVCTCGWVTFGALHEVQAAAAVHDGDDWVSA